MTWRARWWAIATALLTLVPAPGIAADGAPTAVEAPSLPPLPEPPSRDLPAPQAADLQRLDDLLARAASADDAVREAARREVLEVDATLVPAIARRLGTIADQADREAMKQVLEATRRRARSEARKQQRSEGKGGEIAAPDVLEALSTHARPDSKPWRDLLRVVAMSRMLVQVGSLQAARTLIDVYVRFGEFLRIDTQVQLFKLGDRAVPALIETRRHQAEKVARWAEGQLDRLGRAIPGEAVGVQDPEALADVLRAFGRVRDPDAARIVISFANSERAQVRQAARQAVVLMGEVANWQLRDTYENVVGKKPPRDWSWQRTARELFGEFDRLRLSRVYQLFADGQAAERAGDLPRMRAAFDQLLARSPLFERRAEMAAGYFAFARQAGAKERATALEAVLRAERLSTDAAAKKQMRSLRLTLEGEQLLAQGVVDQTLFPRAVELDPDNARARSALRTADPGELDQRSLTARYSAAGVIGVLALAAILLIVLRRGRTPAQTPPAPAPPPEA
jgi:hypothetical protein